MLTKAKKEKIIKEFQPKEKDTGAPETQIALISEEITALLSHLKKHKKDFASKRGLLKMVAKRRRLLEYLKKKDEKAYKELIKKLGLKK